MEIKKTKTEKVVDFLVRKLTLKFLTNFENLSTDQKIAVDIVQLYLRDKDNELYWSPNDSRYIKEKNTFIKLRDIGNAGKITITNHKHQYDILLPQFRYKRLIDEVDKEIEIRRMDMENEILKQVSDKLEEIKQELLEKEKKKSLIVE